MRTQAEWKVDTHISRARPPTSSSTRCRISLAALLVKGMARTEPGWAPRWASSQASRRGGPPALHERPGDPAGQPPGLAGAGARDDKEGRALVHDCLPLGRVEPVEQLVGTRLATPTGVWVAPPPPAQGGGAH